MSVVRVSGDIYFYHAATSGDRTPPIDRKFDFHHHFTKPMKKKTEISVHDRKCVDTLKISLFFIDSGKTIYTVEIKCECQYSFLSNERR